MIKFEGVHEISSLSYFCPCLPAIYNSIPSLILLFFFNLKETQPMVG